MDQPNPHPSEPSKIPPQALQPAAAPKSIAERVAAAGRLPAGGSPAAGRSAVPQRHAPGWASKDVLRASAVVLGLFFGLQLLWLVHPVLLTAFVGLLFGLAVARGADHLERLRVPRGIAAGLIVLTTYGALVGALAIAAPTLGKQFGELRRRLPEAMDRVDQWLAANKGNIWGQIIEGSSGPEGAAAGSPAPASGAPPPPTPAFQPGAAAGHGGIPGGGGHPAKGGARDRARVPAAPAGPPVAPGPAPSSLRVRLAHQLGAASRFLFPFLSSTLEVLAGLLLITFVAIYFAVEPGVYRRGLLHLVPHSSRERADEVGAAISATLRRWLGTQLIAMVVIGSLVSITLALLGVEAALSLGIIAGVCEFIPTIGPILASLPAIAMGFLVSPEKALTVALAFTLVQMLEGHLLIPMLMSRGMNLPPLLTILGQAVMAVLFGFLGLLVAVPLIAAILIAVKMLYVHDVVGDGVPAGPGAT